MSNTYTIQLQDASCTGLQYDQADGGCSSSPVCGSTAPITATPISGATPCSPCSGLSDISGASLSKVGTTIRNYGPLYVALGYGTTPIYGPITEIQPASQDATWDTLSLTLPTLSDLTTASMSILISDGRPDMFLVTTFLPGAQMNSHANGTGMSSLVSFATSGTGSLTLTFTAELPTVMENTAAETTYTGCSAALTGAPYYPSGPIAAVTVDVAVSSGPYPPGTSYYLSYIQTGLTDQTTIAANASPVFTAASPFDSVSFSGVNFAGADYGTDIYLSNGNGTWYLVASDVTLDTDSAETVILGASPLGTYVASPSPSPSAPWSTTKKVIVFGGIALGAVALAALIALLIWARMRHKL